MNFNQVAGNNGHIYPDHGQPVGQNNELNRSFPMLPPQFANLTPQQLQQLRTQPQFQQAMKAWLQKQQQQQFQQQQQQHQIPPQQQMQMSAQQARRMHQMAGGQMGQVPPLFIPQQQSPQTQQAQQAQQVQQAQQAQQVQQAQQAQQVQQVQQAQQQQQMLQQMRAQKQQQQQNLQNAVRGRDFAQNPNMNRNIDGSRGQNLRGAPINAPVQVANQHQQAQMQHIQAQGPPQGLAHQMQNQAYVQARMQGGGPQQPGALNGPQIAGSGSGVQHPGVAVHPGRIPPLPQQQQQQQQQVAALPHPALPHSNALSLNYKQKSKTATQGELANLKDLETKWSTKLSKDGKEVPTDLKIYESVVDKDTKYLQKFPRQLGNNKRMLDGLVQDIKTYADIKQLRMNAIALSHKGHFNNSIWGEGYQGYGNGITNTFTRLVLPKFDKLKSTAVDPKLTDSTISKLIIEDESKESEFVPIRLDFDNERDKFKLRDTFLWNLDEKLLTVEGFVSLLMEDYKSIPPLCHSAIVSAINEQIKDYHKKPINSTGELRIPLKIDITINSTQLVDQFEWDILNFEDNDPEEFAATLSDEMNLPGEFATAIAHSIREQIQLFHKALTIVGYGFDGSAVHEDEIRSHILPSLRVPEGGLISDNTPTLVKLTQLELDRLDKEMERESRRKRRHNNNDSDLSTTGRGGSSRRAAVLAQSGRGNGPVMPDLSEMPKTLRTPAPSSVLPGGVDLTVPDIFTYNEVAVQRSQIPNPDYKPPANNNRVKYHHDQLRRTEH